MKKQLTVNVSRLLEWAAFCGHENPRIWLSREVGCSKTLIDHVFCGTVPGAINRLRICRATGIKEADLFQACEAVKESA
jgi:hypothetical protein